MGTGCVLEEAVGGLDYDDNVELENESKAVQTREARSNVKLEVSKISTTSGLGFISIVQYIWVGIGYHIRIIWL